jgi:hypothetical protein
MLFESVPSMFPITYGPLRPTGGFIPFHSKISTRGGRLCR